MKLYFLLLCFWALVCAQVLPAQSHFHRSAKNMKPDKEFTDFLVQPLFSDSNATGYVIWVKTGIALHYHAFHSETAYILSGKALVTLDDQTVSVKKGDLMFIPKGTRHSVKVTRGVLKLISLQAPEFDSAHPDRIFIKAP